MDEGRKGFEKEILTKANERRKGCKFGIANALRDGKA